MCPYGQKYYSIKIYLVNKFSSLLQHKISLYDLLSSIEGRAREVPEDAAFALGNRMSSGSGRPTEFPIRIRGNF